MIDWLHGLPFVWLVVVVFGAAYLVAAAIAWAVLSVRGRRACARVQSRVAGMLPPLGLVFGLLVGFLAAQVWNDVGQAQTAVNREASALRAVVLLDASFPGRPEAQDERRWCGGTSRKPYMRNGRPWPVSTPLSRSCQPRSPRRSG